MGTRSRGAAKATTAAEADRNQSARAASTRSSCPRRGQKRAAADAAQGEITAFLNRGSFDQYSHSDSAGDPQILDAATTEEVCDRAEDHSRQADNQDEGKEQATRISDELMSDEDETRPQGAKKRLQPHSKRARGGNRTVADCDIVSTRRTKGIAVDDGEEPELMVDSPSGNDSAAELCAADVLVELDLASVLDASTRSMSVNEQQDCAGGTANGRVSRFLHANLAQDIRARRSSAAAADDKATHELARSLAKEDFEQMEVLGQFNRGFIIAKLRDDLFIVDQHACDEKHNFETMQATTKLHTQRMVNSMPLEVQITIN